MQHYKTSWGANGIRPAVAHILLVEDDVTLRDMLITALKAEGFTTTHARSLAAAHAILAAAAAMGQLPQGVLLDLNLPDGHGGQLYTRWAGLAALPVIALAAHHNEYEKTALLEAGVQAYLAKPLDVDELLARLRQALRIKPSTTLAAPRAVRTGALEIDVQARRIQCEGNIVRLTTTELNVLVCLAKRLGQITTHQHILTEVWGAQFIDHTHYLRVYVASLRAKLEPEPTQPRYVLTEIGIGYRLADLN